jgi:hypothetical protein
MLSLPILVFGLILLWDCLKRPVYERGGKSSKKKTPSPAQLEVKKMAQDKKKALEAYQLEKQKSQGSKKSGSNKIGSKKSNKRSKGQGKG